MKCVRFLILLTAGFSLLAACQKPTDYSYILPDSKPIRKPIKIKEVVGTNMVDILWVVDDSGSMSHHQINVIKNLDMFISGLVSSSALNWKMALVSTSYNRNPIAGFEVGRELVSTDPNASIKFKAAVQSLGAAGDSRERTFDPVIKALQLYPGFSRPGVPLAIIVVSDAPEQSSTSAQNFIKFMENYKGSLSPIYFYGFLNPIDWCTATDDRWTWSGSPFEKVSKRLKGHVYKLCDPQFASNLNDLGQDLSRNVSISRVFLRERPLLSSLRVLYKGQPVMGGLRDKGGYWIYRYDANAIEFLDMSFAPGANEDIEIVYDRDLGIR